jgi:uncharacterized membrane protein (UPF0127 family)
VRTFDFKRAATRAALFCCLALLPLLPLVTDPAFAKMRLDRLSIQPSGGGSPHAFDIELATTDQEKSLGLMFRTKLGDSEGMLFPYGAATDVSMWMRNTYIPLDMVFIRADGTIHRIEVNAEPLSDRVISSGGAVSAVLELAGGATGRLGIKAGDHVNYAIFGAANKP